MATLARNPASDRRWDRWLAGGVLGAIAAVAALSLALSETVAAGHALFHLALALVGAVPAALLAIRRAPTRVTLVAATGFLLLAIAQLLEAIGAWGFAPDNDTVISGIKALHDLGLALAPLGLIGAVIGAGAAVWAVAARRLPPFASIIVAVVIVAVGLVVVAKLIGM